METVDERALKIAAKVMDAAGLCLYESRYSCNNKRISCDACIRSWLLKKAKQELKKEGKLS